MARTVNQVMTLDPRTVKESDTLTAAAAQMRDGDVGVLVVVREGNVVGVVTDRDLVVRAIADGRDPNATTIGDVASETGLVTITEDQPETEAARLMREHAIRRIVVVDGGRAIGIVSIGDLAIQLDTDSALADISAESPNR
jgi:CBS domain-containing protein